MDYSFSWLRHYTQPLHTDVSCGRDQWGWPHLLRRRVRCAIL